MKVATNEELLDRIRALIDGMGTQGAVATYLGVKQSSLSDTLRGKRCVSPLMAQALGYERRTFYVPLEKEKP